jgi:amidase
VTAPTTSIDPFSPALDMLAALRAGELRAVELFELHLERIGRINPVLNAIVIPNYDAARKRAAHADATRAKGASLGRVHGLPLTLKDCIEAAGLPSTAGLPELASNVPARDGPVAARVLGAGAVLLGKTNVPPRAGDWQSSNPIFGRTVNPWDHSRTPGGSTGGGAAALAAGLTPLEFGSDVGGSIRVPAAFCGVYGHRPSETAVPRSGHVPGTSDPNPAAIMSVQGPLARTAADLELGLDVIAGPEPGEETAWQLRIPPARHHRLSSFRVAVLPRLDWLPVDAEILAALDGLASWLSGQGAKVAAAQPEGFDAREHHAVYTELLELVNFSGEPPDRRARIAGRLRGVGDDFSEAAARGVEASAGDFAALLARRERYRAMFRDFFRQWDVLLAPITLVPAFPHDDRPFHERSLAIDGVTVPYARQLVYPGVSTLAGQPATAFPAGRSREGLPLGLQAIGPYLEDRTPIRFAGLVERGRGGFERPPGY